jgi:hypothetical protein
MRILLALVVVTWVVTSQPVRWGGDHIEMEVTGEGARVEFDCASGTIDAPLKVNASGAFSAAGSFTPERPGPARDDGPAAMKATYRGTIDGDTMTLQLAIEGQDVRRFSLTRGERGRVRKCR